MLILILVLVGCATAGLVWAVDQIAEAYRSASWPRVEGQIVHFAIDRTRGVDGDNLGKPVVTYRYGVNEQEYQGGRVRFGGWPSFLGRISGEALARRYRVGSTVAVAYDPSDPSESVLEPGKLSNAIMSGVLFLSLLVIGIVTLAYN